MLYLFKPQYITTHLLVIFYPVVVIINAITIIVIIISLMTSSLSSSPPRMCYFMGTFAPAPPLPVCQVRGPFHLLLHHLIITTIIVLVAIINSYSKTKWNTPEVQDLFWEVISSLSAMEKVFKDGAFYFWRSETRERLDWFDSGLRGWKKSCSCVNKSIRVSQKNTFSKK